MKQSILQNVGLVLILAICICFPEKVYAGNKRTVAFVMKSLSNPFWLKVDKGAREYAQKHDIRLEMFGVERETNVDHQIGIMENLISRKYGVIVLAPNDSKRLVPIVQKAHSHGIAVINIDNPLDPDSLKKLGLEIPFIGPDNFAGGEMVGKYVRSKLKGVGSALVIEGMIGVSNSDKRKNGFIQGVTTQSSITVDRFGQGNWHSDEAFSAVVNSLDKRGPVDAIFCANDVMATGALQALEVYGLAGKIVLAGYDNIEIVRNEMRRGRIHATVEQHPELLGEYGVRLAWASLNGRKVPAVEEIPLDLITSDHIDKKIVFSISEKESPFSVELMEGAQKEAELMGIDLKILDAENDSARQLVSIITAMKEHVDVLVITPTNGTAMLPVMLEAEEKGIPVITVDRRIPSDMVLQHISSNNREGGRIVADFFSEKLGAKGALLELEGIPGTSAGYERGEGFNKALEKYPELSITDRETAGFNRQRAKAITTRLLMEGKTFDGVFAHNDEMIFGVLDAFEELQLAMPKVLVGYDGLQQAREHVRSGRLDATIVQNPTKMGEMAVESAVRFFRGEDISKEMTIELELLYK